jgi:hypothetical protein
MEMEADRALAAVENNVCEEANWPGARKDGRDAGFWIVQ